MVLGVDLEEAAPCRNGTPHSQAPLTKPAYPEQEHELVKSMDEETQGHQPPGRFLVFQKASLMAGKPVGNGVVYCFLKRHEDVFVCKKNSTYGPCTLRG
jgi:hypothetical protein